MVDARSHGKLPFQNHYIRGYGVCSRRSFRSVHVKRTKRRSALNIMSLTGNLYSQMSYDTPLSPSGQQLTNLPLREQLRTGFKDMGSRSFSSAKNFGLVGAIFAGTECCIEGVRENDVIGMGNIINQDIVPGEE